MNDPYLVWAALEAAEAGDDRLGFAFATDAGPVGAAPDEGGGELDLAVMNGLGRLLKDARWATGRNHPIGEEVGAFEANPQGHRHRGTARGGQAASGLEILLRQDAAQMTQALLERDQRIDQQQAALQQLSRSLDDLQADVVRWRCRSAEFQNLAERAREELDQVRSQRNVARSEVEAVQRRWQQQVRQYELQLNASRVECERLQRALDSARAEQPFQGQLPWVQLPHTPVEPPAKIPAEAPPDTPPPASAATPSAPSPTMAAKLAAVAGRSLSDDAASPLRHVFTRLRGRWQDQPRGVNCSQ